MKFKTLLIILSSFLFFSCATLFTDVFKEPAPVPPPDPLSKYEGIKEIPRIEYLMYSQSNFLNLSKVELDNLFRNGKCEEKFQKGIEEWICIVPYAKNLNVQINILFDENEKSLLALISPTKNTDPQVFLYFYEYEFARLYEDNGVPKILTWDPSTLKPDVNNRKLIFTKEYTEVATWQLKEHSKEYVTIVLNGQGGQVNSIVIHGDVKMTEFYLRDVFKISRPNTSIQKHTPKSNPDFIGPI